ncbi:MAG: hypothetical protein Q8L35_05930 [Actinomycetota bacterium]|nr:hypothetical protein [Actinomycetota bacterium]
MASFNDRIKEYGSTPTGKIVVIAAPVAVLVLIVAVVALTMLGSGSSDVQQAGDLKPLGSTAASGTDAAAPAESTSPQTLETSEPPVNQDYEVFETRDPFKRPDATETQSSPVTASPTSASATGTATPAAGQQSSVLSLKSVSSQNGVLYANVDYGANSYVVRAGERVGASPYQITSVSSENATFLYGDDSLTLRVGEDVQK